MFTLTTTSSHNGLMSRCGDPKVGGAGLHCVMTAPTSMLSTRAGEFSNRLPVAAVALFKAAFLVSLFVYLYVLFVCLFLYALLFLAYLTLS